jgi:hypothetical protein
MSPLFKGKSKKAFSKNVETEMDEGKPQKQSLAIAFSMQKRKPKKKMAKGGEITADTEKRPDPDQTFNDSKETARKGDKHNASGWLDNKKEAGKSGPTKPNTASAGNFSNEDMTDEDKANTVEEMNMVEGPSTDPKKVNANHLKMANGGPVNFSNEARPTTENASDDREFAMKKENYSDPMGINAHHSEDIKDALLMAHGGDVGEHDTIVEAIMRKRRNMAEGGQVDIDSNNQEQPNSYYPRNEDHTVGEPADQDFQDSSQPEDSNEHGRDLPQDSKEESLVDAIRRKSKKNPYKP